MYDLIIIGAGPAGYVAAIRAGQIGLKTAIIDKKYIGGMCLNWGCIPTKTLIESAKLYDRIKNAKDFAITGIDKENLNFDWKLAQKRVKRVTGKLTRGVQYLLKKNGVEIIEGEAVIVDEHKIDVNSRLLETKNIFIATGSYPDPVGVNNKDLVLNLENLMSEESLPENPVIIGSGTVAVEMAQLFKMLDRNVVLLNSEDSILPGMDNHFEQFIVSKFRKDKIQYFPVSDWKMENDEVFVNAKKIEFDRIINCNLRNAVIPESKLAFRMENGFIKTDHNLLTSISGIYAVGDVNGRASVAHSASAQGLAAVNHLRGIENQETEIDLLNVYSNPEMAQIGKTEQELEESGTDFKVSEFSLSANGKALAEGNTEGKIRVLSEKKYGEVLGVQIIAANATDLIAEASALMKIEGTVFDLSKTIHAHPTVSEVFMEAGFDAIDEPLHK